MYEIWMWNGYLEKWCKGSPYLYASRDEAEAYVASLNKNYPQHIYTVRQRPTSRFQSRHSKTEIVIVGGRFASFQRGRVVMNDPWTGAPLESGAA